ncbi:MAG: acetoin utilization protein AcuC [Thiotrichales bacterium]
MSSVVEVYLGEALASYHFGPRHPFGAYRYPAFERAFHRAGLAEKTRLAEPAPPADDAALTLFHTEDYVARVKRQSETGAGVLDEGDTPAFRGVYEAAATVAGTALRATHRLVHGDTRRAFIPIAGLHHARRDSASGFCVFNDCAIVIEALRRWYGIHNIAYVDIDAHHGDGVFYAFEADPELIFADLHEDGRYLYPGSGRIDETGKGAAKGTKLNIPMPPYSDDGAFREIWSDVITFLERFKPEFVILQCGVDSLRDDPLTHLQYSPHAHAHATATLCQLADRFAAGRLLALGGGGYNPDNIAEGWTTVVRTLVEATPA